MRILLITKPLASPWTDSGKIVPRDLLYGASGRHHYHVLTPRGSVQKWPEWVTAHPVYHHGGQYRVATTEQLRLFYSIWRIRNQVDVFHFFFQPHPTAVKAAAMLSQVSGRPAVHTALSTPRDGANARGLVFAHATVALSTSTAERLSLPGGKAVAVIPPGLVPSSRADRIQAQSVASRVGLETPYFLYPGDYEFSGGHRFLLQLWRQDPNLPDLVFTGRDKTPRAVEVLQELQRECGELGLGKRVHFLRTVQELSSLIAAAQAILFPAVSLYAKTDMPLVLLEAWREETPILVSDLPPLVEWVTGAGAVLPANPEVWLAAIRGLAGAKEDFIRMGVARLESRFSAHQAAADYEKIYEQIERENMSGSRAS